MGRLSRWAYASPVLEEIQRAGRAVLWGVVNDALVVQLALQQAAPHMRRQGKVNSRVRCAAGRQRAHDFFQRFEVVAALPVGAAIGGLAGQL